MTDAQFKQVLTLLSRISRDLERLADAAEREQAEYDDPDAEPVTDLAGRRIG